MLLSTLKPFNFNTSIKGLYTGVIKLYFHRHSPHSLCGVWHQADQHFDEVVDVIVLLVITVRLESVIEKDVCCGESYKVEILQ